MKFGFLLLLVSTLASASTITIDADPTRISNVASAGFQTRYKIDQGNWDMMLGNGEQPVNSNSILTRQLGNLNQLNSTTWLYEVENLPGQGMYFKLTNTATQSSHLLAWGSFQPNVLPSAGSSTVVATLDSVTPTPFYSALQLIAVATAQGSVSYSNASFTVKTAGINTVGTMPSSGSAVNSGTNALDQVYIAYTDDNGQALDLGDVAWAFSSNVTISRTPSGGSEALKFELNGSTLDYASEVPEPATLMMTGAMLSIGALVARSRLVKRVLVDPREEVAGGR